MKYLVFSFLIFLFSPQANAYVDEYAALLKAHVKKVEKPFVYYGVDYDAWSQDRNHKRARTKIQKTKIDEFKTDNEQAAFLINAYNFFLIDLIIQTAERDSIKDLDGVSNVFERYKWSIDGKVYVLKDIENEIWNLTESSKIYFGLSCAAKSCPDIRNEPYEGKRLNAQLNEQIKTFLQNQDKGFQNIPNVNAVKVSALFKAQDNKFNHGNLRPWLQPYFPLLVNAGTKIEYINFDWSLNLIE